MEEIVVSAMGTCQTEIHKEMGKGKNGAKLSAVYAGEEEVWSEEKGDNETGRRWCE